jgi:hypothetical protein
MTTERLLCAILGVLIGISCGLGMILGAIR